MTHLDKILLTSLFILLSLFAVMFLSVHYCGEVWCL